MKKTRYKIMLGLIKKIFIGLLVGSVNESNQKVCFVKQSNIYD